jgi:hypothetical protein
VDRVFAWWRVNIYVPLAVPLIFIEHANELLCHRYFNTLM